MHPTLAHYLDLATTLAAVERIDRKEALSDDERALASVLRRAPEHKKALLAAQGRPRASESGQQALVYLAANAAVERLRESPEATSALTQADVSLRTHGASDAQVAGLLAAVLIEEAFGYEDDADTFDLPFVIETFGELSLLGALDADRVEQLREGLASVAQGKALDETRRAFDALVSTAWGEGPEPINPEHVQEAVHQLGSPEHLEAVLRHLGQAKLVGPLRLSRLLERLSPPED